MKMAEVSSRRPTLGISCESGERIAGLAWTIHETPARPGRILAYAALNWPLVVFVHAVRLVSL
jgi:hypothetical protein